MVFEKEQQKSTRRARAFVDNQGLKERIYFVFDDNLVNHLVEVPFQDVPISADGTVVRVIVANRRGLARFRQGINRAVAFRVAYRLVAIVVKSASRFKIVSLSVSGTAS